METLIRLRPVDLVAFLLGAVAMVYATANRDELLYLLAVAICFGGSTAFLVTEAFGRIAQARSSASRWIARLFLIPSSLVSGSVLFLIVRYSFHHIVT